MADIPVNVIVGVKFDRSQLRTEANRVRDALSNVAINVELNVDPAEIRRRINQAAGEIAVNISSVNLSEQATNGLRQQVETAIGSPVIRRIGIQRSVLESIRNNIEQTLSDINIDVVANVQPAAPVGGAARQGGAGAVTGEGTEVALGTLEQVANQTVAAFNALLSNSNRASQSQRATTQASERVRTATERLAQTRERQASRAESQGSRDIGAELDALDITPLTQLGDEQQNIINEIIQELGILPDILGQAVGALREPVESLVRGVGRAATEVQRRTAGRQQGREQRGQAIEEVSTAGRAFERQQAVIQKLTAQELQLITQLQGLGTQAQEANSALSGTRSRITEINQSFQRNAAAGNTNADESARLAIALRTERARRQRQLARLNALEGAQNALTNELLANRSQQARSRSVLGQVESGFQQRARVLFEKFSKLGLAFDGLGIPVARLAGEADAILSGKAPPGTPAAAAVGRGDLKIQRSNEVLIRANNQLAAQRLRAVRNQLGESTSIADLQTTERQLKTAQQRLLRSTESLARERQRTSVDTARSVGALAGGGQAQAFQSALGRAGLDTNAQAKFVDIIGQQGGAISRTTALFKAHNGTIGRTSGLVSNVNRQFDVGTKAAFEFGRAAASAAERFLAWAAPAQFIFRAISLLQESVTAIFALDQAATRLAFFQPSFFENIGNSAESAAGRMSKIDVSLQDILTSATATGLSLQQVGEAFIEIARVGVGIDRNTGVVNQAEVDTFRLAVTALVQIEGGALQARDAVTQLNAITQQFGLTGEDAVLVAGLLFQTSRQSAFSVGQLADATARVGSAFAGIQNLRIDEVIRLIGAGATVTGASVSRLATAFRQLSTLVSQNAEELEQFGITLTDVEGGSANIQAVFEILDRIQGLSRTQAQRTLASLIADRRNIADIIALSRNVDALRDSIGEVSEEQNIAALASDAVNELFTAQAQAAQTLEQRLERLRTSVVGVVEGTGIRNFLGETIDGFRGFVGILGSAANLLTQIAPLLKGLAIAKVAKFATGFGAGFLQERIGGRLQRQSLQQAGVAADRGRTQEAINQGLNAEVITKARAVKLEEKQLAINLRRVRAEAELDKLLSEEVNEKNRLLTTEQQIGIKNEKQKQDLAKILELEKAIGRASKEQGVFQREVNAALVQGQATRGGIGNRVGRAAGQAGLFAVAGLGIALSSQFAESITAGNKKALDELDSQSLNLGNSIGAGILQGAAIGAVGGFAFGGIGAGVGALVGGIGGAVTGLVQFNAQEEEIEEGLKRQTQQRALSTAALKRQLELISAQGDAEEGALNELDRLRKNGADIQKEIAELQARTQSLTEQEAEDRGLLNDIQEKQLSLIRVQAQLSEREAARLQQRIRLERDIVSIRAEGARLLEISNTIEEARISSLELVGDTIGTAEVKLEFDREELRVQALNIQRELSRTTFEINLLTRESGREQEARRLAAEQERLQQQQLSNSIQAIQIELRGRRQILQASRQEAEQQIRAWESAAKNVTQAFSSAVKFQERVAGSIKTEGQIFNQILEAQSQVAADTIRNATGAADDPRLQQRIARVQASIVEQQLNLVVASVGSQLAELEDAAGLDIGVLQDASDSLADDFASVSANVREAGRQVPNSIRLQNAAINENIRSLEGEINARISFVRAEIGARREIISSINSLVSARQQELTAIRARIEEEANVGQALLETPQEFVNQLRQVLTAQNFLEGLGGPARDVVQGIEGRIVQLAQGAGGGGGGAAIRQVFAGLQAAQELNVRLVESLSPQRLSSVFAQLQLSTSSDVNSLLSEEQNTISEIERLRQSTITELQTISSLQSENTQAIRVLQNIQSERAVQASLNEENLSSKLQAFIDTEAAARQGLTEVQSEILSLQSEFESAINELANSINFDIGAESITSNIQETNRLLSIIVETDPAVTPFREEFGSLVSELGRLRFGQVTPALEEQIQTDNRELLNEFRALKASVSALANLRGPLDDRRREGLASVLENANIDIGNLNELPQFEILNRLRDRFDDVRQRVRADDGRQEAILERTREIIDQINNSPVLRALSGGSFAESVVGEQADGFSDEAVESLVRAMDSFSDSLGDRSSFGDTDLSNRIQEAANAGRESANAIAQIAQTFGANTSQLSNLTESLTQQSSDNVDAVERLRLDLVAHAERQTRALEDQRQRELLISQESIGSLNQSIVSAGEEAANSISDSVARIKETVESSTVNISVDDIRLEVVADIRQAVEDGGLVQSLSDALSGTPLQGEIEIIRTALLDAVNALQNNSNPPLVIDTDAIGGLRTLGDNR